MSLNNQGRPTGVGAQTASTPTTISGDRGLDHEEKLIFELGHGAVGVDLPSSAALQPATVTDLIARGLEKDVPALRARGEYLD